MQKFDVEIETDVMIFENVLDAIESIDSNNVLLNSRKSSGFAVKTTNYEMVKLPNNSIATLKANVPSCFFRGEAGDYQQCKASLYRIDDFENRLIALLKTYHFIDFLHYVPEVQEFERRNFYVGYWILAQHYEFPTPVIDLTDELVVAAFFATHSYDKVINRYVIKNEGLGAIRFCDSTLLKNGKIRPVGIQPFARPSQQDGYELMLSEKDDFSNYSQKVVFKQNFEVNKRLNRAILGGIDYFPVEDIAIAAKFIWESDLITHMSIDAFLEDQKNGANYLGRNVDMAEIQKILKKKKYHIVDAEIISPSYERHSTGLVNIRKFIQRPAYRG